MKSLCMLLFGLAIVPLAPVLRAGPQIPVDDMDNWYCEYFAGGVGPDAGMEGARRGRGWASTLAFDAYGNGYLAGGSVVLVFTPDDQVHRVAGAGLPGDAEGNADLACLSGASVVACHPTDNYLFVNDLGGKVIKKITRGADGTWTVARVAGQADKSGHQDGPGREALLQRVDGIALDSKGNLYMMDQDWLRRLSPDGQLVTLNPKGGSGAFGPGLEHDLESARFNRIMGAGQLACDENDNLLVADKWNGTFVRVDFQAGKVIVLAGGPARGSPGFRDSNNVTDGPGNSVAVFFAGGGPGGLAYDRLTKRVYTTTADEHAIRAIMPDGMVKTLGPWTKDAYGMIAEGPVRQTRGGGWIAGVDTQGRVYVGTRPGRIYRFYRKPGIAGAPPLKTPNPLLPWPQEPASAQDLSENIPSRSGALGDRALPSSSTHVQEGRDGAPPPSVSARESFRTGKASSCFRIAFAAPPATNLLCAGPAVVCGGASGAVDAFCVEVLIGDIKTNVFFAPRQASIGATTMVVRAEVAESPAGVPAGCVRGEIRKDGSAGETWEIAMDACNPAVVRDGRSFVVAYEQGNVVWVRRYASDGRALDPAPQKMGERWQSRPALGCLDGTVVVTAARAPRHNPWGWGGPAAMNIGRLLPDGRMPENVRVSDTRITEGGFPGIVDSSQWKGRVGWPAGTRGGFKDTENGYWPGPYSSVAWDGRTWVMAWTRYRVKNPGDTDIFACRVDRATMLACSPPVLVAGGSGEPGAQTQPALIGLGNGRSLLVYLAVQPDGRVQVQARLLSGGCLAEPSGAPTWQFPSCLAPAKRVFVTDWCNWAREAASIPALTNVPIVTVATDAANTNNLAGPVVPWVTDQWLFGRRAGQSAVVQFPRASGMEAWGERYFSQSGWPVISPGRVRGGAERRFDAGGNVVALPAAGNRNVAGCLAVSAQLAPAIKQFLADISGGRMAEFDTRWLKVGHLDEILSVVPCGKDQFRYVLPDAEAGLKLLESAPADRVLFGAQSGRVARGKVTQATVHAVEASSTNLTGGAWKYVRIISGPCAGLIGRIIRADEHRLLIDKCWDLRQGPAGTLLCRMKEGRVDTMPIWFEAPSVGSEFVAVEDACLGVDGSGEEFPAFLTAGELRSDEGLRVAARQVHERVDGPLGIREMLVRQLGVNEGEIIRLPVLFSGRADEQSVTSLVPNPINLVMLGNTAALLRPHGPRADPARSDTDLFEAAWRRALGEAGVTPVFLDGWDLLHRLNGGVRCGMNVMRESP